MVEYIVFFGLLTLATTCFIVHEIRSKGQVIDKTQFEIELSKTESPIETILFKALWFNDFQVVTQYPVGRYRLDMAIPSLKICIEADGKDYHSSPAQKQHDRKRDSYLKGEGWTTIRFSGSQISRNPVKCIKKVESIIAKKHSTV